MKLVLNSYNNFYDSTVKMSWHNKIIVTSDTKEFNDTYDSIHTDISEITLKDNYYTSYGHDSIRFSDNYINGRSLINFYRLFIDRYASSIPEQGRCIFKDRYTVEFVGSFTYFLEFRDHFSSLRGTQKYKNYFYDNYTSENTEGGNVYYVFNIDYNYIKLTQYNKTIVDQYIDNQLSEALVTYTFTDQYENIVSTSTSEQIVTETNEFGIEQEVSYKLKPSVEKSSSGYRVIIPIAINGIIKDELGNSTDVSMIITFPPKYYNFKVTGFSIDDYRAYERLYAQNPDAELNLGNNMSSRLLKYGANPAYNKIQSDILEFIIDGISIDETYSSLADVAKQIPAITLSFYSNNGANTNIIIENGDIYVPNDIWDAGLDFANMVYRQRDTRDETIFYGFEKDVVAESQLFTVRIRTQNACCLDKIISVGKQVASCYIPKSGSTTTIVDRTYIEQLRVSTLNGFQRIIAPDISGSAIDLLGRPYDQPDEDGSLEESDIYQENHQMEVEM